MFISKLLVFSISNEYFVWCLLMNLIIAREIMSVFLKKKKGKGLLDYLIRSPPSSKSSPTLFSFLLFFSLVLFLT